MSRLIVLGDTPACVFCEKPAEIMLFKQESKDDINMFLICGEHWNQFRHRYISVPEAFAKALDDEN